jgi:3-hydroxyacyl-CoA dehydrogenase
MEITNQKNSMKKIAVVGAGTMGNGIAHVFAQKGFEVNLIDSNNAALEKAIQTIEKNLTRQVSKGIINEAEKQNALQNISTFTVIKAGLQHADLAIEAATENSEIKKSIFKYIYIYIYSQLNVLLFLYYYFSYVFLAFFFYLFFFY